MCHEHATTAKLPDLDVESSFQGQVEARADKKLEELQEKKEKAALRVKKRAGIEEDTENLFFPGMRGDVLTAEEDLIRSKLEEEDETVDGSVDGLWTFCLPCDFKKEVRTTIENTVSYAFVKFADSKSLLSGRWITGPLQASILPPSALPPLQCVQSTEASTPSW